MSESETLQILKLIRKEESLRHLGKLTLESDEEMDNTLMQPVSLISWLANC